MEQVGIAKIKEKEETEYEYIQSLTKWIVFDLANNKIRRNMIDNKEIYLNHGGSHKNIMISVCSWLSEMVRV